jgi:hypothetical protein
MAEALQSNTLNPFIRKKERGKEKQERKKETLFKTPREYN